MNQKITSESVRFAPIALALVLFFVLGLLAFQTKAHANGPDSSALKEQMEENMKARQELMDEQTQERQQFMNETREEFQEAREAGMSQEDRDTLRADVVAERRMLYEENSAERAELHDQAREALHASFEEKKEALQTKMEERKQEREEKMEERKAQFSVQVQARLSQYSERIVERMNTAIDRLEQIAGRIESRIEKMEESGVDLSDAKAELEDVYVLLESAEGYIVLVSEVSVDTFTSDDPASQKEEVREAVLLAKDGIKEVHTALSETVQLIRASFGEGDNMQINCNEYTYSTCPESCEKVCVSSACNENGECTADCDGENSCVEKVDDDDDTSSDTVETVSFEHSFADGVHTYRGVLTTPTPCYTVEATSVVAESYPEQVTLSITSAEDGSEACGAVLDEKEFIVEATASEEAVLINVEVNGETVDWEIVD